MYSSAIFAERLRPYIDALQGSPIPPEMFAGCFNCTIDTTVTPKEDGTLFVITGDIPAMWLRDSSAQVMHYVRFADEPDVADIIKRLLATQMQCILIDPYANSFNQGPNDNHSKLYVDTPAPSAWVWERKYELDSLCFPLLLSKRFIEKTGDYSFVTAEYLKALRLITDTVLTETRVESSPYRFQRQDSPDSMPNDGRGLLLKYTGMSRSAFRPSDDRCEYGYLVPSNLMALSLLPFVEELFIRFGDTEYAKRAGQLKAQIEYGIQNYGIYNHPKYGKIYAYETDGEGNYLLMDDANMPGLLSLPILGICDINDEIYQNTRRFVLSEDNPFFFRGKYAEGVGSPHTYAGYIWPIGICSALMTEQDPARQKELLNMLLTTHGSTYRMHESFDPNAPESFSRSWFAWADSVFAETVCQLIEKGAC